MIFGIGTDVVQLERYAVSTSATASGSPGAC
jgi:phosphopantetheinyl transferase (holo-ACP synthase)